MNKEWGARPTLTGDLKREGVSVSRDHKSDVPRGEEKRARSANKLLRRGGTSK